MKYRKIIKICEILIVFFSVNMLKLNIYLNIIKNCINIYLSYKKIVKYVKLNIILYIVNVGIFIVYYGLKLC